MNKIKPVHSQHASAVLKIRTKTRLAKAINQIDKHLCSAKNDLDLAKEIIDFSNGKYKSVMRREFAFWDQVFRAIVDSCMNKLSRLYDSPDFRSKRKSIPNLNLHSFLLEIKFNTAIQKWIPTFNHKVLVDIDKDISSFENYYLKAKLRNIRNKFLSHFDAAYMMGKPKNKGIGLHEIDKLLSFAVQKLQKYGRLFPMELVKGHEIYIVSGTGSLKFDDLESILNKLSQFQK